MAILWILRVKGQGCYWFASSSKCDYKDCKYSHDPGDIKAYKALKAVGKDKFQAVQHQWGGKNPMQTQKPAVAHPAPGIPQVSGDARRRV